MPELPEVETIKRRLKPLVLGKQFQQIQVLKDKSFRGNPDQILKQKIIDLQRRAKVLRFKFANGSNLLVHLKMTGQLIFVSDQLRVGGGHPSADWVNDLPAKHTRVILNFADNETLFFNDMRIFGWLWLMDDEQAEQELKKYGPDVIDPLVTPFYLHDKFSRKQMPIKQAIMDNSIMAGVGNIYASEALFLAKIHPQRPAKSLTLAELETLHHYLLAVIEASIAVGGTTFDGKYVDVSGFAGGFQHQLKVYGKVDEKCEICGEKIKKVKLGGRSSFYCEKCQR